MRVHGYSTLSIADGLPNPIVQNLYIITPTIAGEVSGETPKQKHLPRNAQIIVDFTIISSNSAIFDENPDFFRFMHPFLLKAVSLIIKGSRIPLNRN